jgi:KipI family sensor histidine kinase inhibitor
VSAPHQVLRVAERALLVRFLDEDLARAVARTHAFLAFLQDEEQRLSVKGEWIPGAGNLLVRLEDSVAAREVEDLRRRLGDWSDVFPFDESFSEREVVSVAVEFGGENGPDLAAVARETGLAESEVLARLCGAVLTVAFVGFSPGFPYLIGLPRELEVPRLASPRPRVPAGSVAIAGPFAGIYPSATPGGWRLLGRTALPLFDPAADPPARLAPGDRLRFVAAGGTS